MKHLALFLALLPSVALAQPEIKPINGLPFPLVSPEEAVKLNGGLKTIKLHLRDVTLRAALEEVSRQSGVALRLSDAPPDVFTKVVSLDIETTLVREAASAVFEKAGIVVSLAHSQSAQGYMGEWFVSSRAPLKSELPKSKTGPFEFVAMKFVQDTTKGVDFGQAPQHGSHSSLRFDMVFSHDPQVDLVDTPKFFLTRAEDDQGRLVAVSQRPAPSMKGFLALLSLVYFSGSIVEGQTSFSLSAPPEGARTISRLEGKAVCLVTTRREKWELPDILNAKNAAHEFKTTQGTATVSIANVVQTGATIEFDARVSGAPRSFALSGERLLSSIQVFDANGQPLESRTLSSKTTDEEANARLAFSLRGTRPGRHGEREGALNFPKPARLLMDVPVEWVQTEVPFSFKDLPLP